MLENIEYKDYKKKLDIHGTVLYPASMIAPMQSEVLLELIKNHRIFTIFDPFHGSGTALYEAMMIDSNIHLIGCDINPLANLITKVKLQGVSKNIENNFKILKERIKKPEYIENILFPNVEKWFRKDILETIELIKAAIQSISDQEDRQFFWVILCDCIRKYSNTRSSTYKLHIKEKEKIERMKNNLEKDYIKSIDNAIEKYCFHSNNFTLYKKDTLDLLTQLPENYIDITISSPPYGDNATTVPYGQFSMLALYIIDQRDLNLEGWELNNYSIIDSRSMGSNKKGNTLSLLERQLIEPYVEKISSKKKEKVIDFFNDYFIFLQEICRITKGYIALTLGNRTVDRIKINLADITRLYLEENSFKNIEFAERDILNKRTPKITSLVNSQPVSSMNKEYMIVHKRT